MSLKEILVTNISQIEPKHTAPNQIYEFDRYDVSGLLHENKCTVTFYSLSPGKSNYPYHYHTGNEEVFYIISGQGVLETPAGGISVKEGDVIVFPPCKDGAHRLTNTSENEKLVYLDVDTNTSPYVVIYPHTNKVGVFVKGEFPKFYKQDSNVPYYEDE
ncbi:cupin domain-containing protein [Sebaldella sp. S0638]|uniref:cupin domain-containing protein n=1 Tax=Sebaldella sp. S0638 TaxID=2957809 RepID=UPI00209CB3AE|nr:cupin domain-containing protein [Sebaldella sp. S0638]MCP1226206.1 cupin domain-containing protein [Sebaldella sp. S0638]